jgi:hypothetical protein
MKQSSGRLFDALRTGTPRLRRESYYAAQVPLASRRSRRIFRQKDMSYI